MRIRIIKPGMFSTIQDEGRGNYLSQAVPVSGAMDTLASRVANMAVGNPKDAAVIEFTFADAGFITETDVIMSYSGDGAIFFAGDQEIKTDRAVCLPSGTEVRLRANPCGIRTYLAISGGFNVPQVMGSRSTYQAVGLGGFEGRALQSGDVLNSNINLTPIAKNIADSLIGNTIKSASWSIARHLFLPEDRMTIRIVPAHEFTWFTGSSILNFLSHEYVLSQQSNRMGYRLEGPKIEHAVTKELLSTAVTPGTIQVTNDGSLILLMADCQTTGGYPRIAQVAAVDMPLCGQLKPGDAVNFKEISRHEAETLYLEHEAELHLLAVAIKSKYL